MSRALALSRSAFLIGQDEALRRVIVCGCALALILAGAATPF